MSHDTSCCAETLLTLVMVSHKTDDILQSIAVKLKFIKDIEILHRHQAGAGRRMGEERGDLQQGPALDSHRDHG